MNILVCSVGRRVKLVKYFKDELNKIGGKVIAVDCDATAPALQFADIGLVVPAIDQPNYLQQIKELCKTYRIRGIISLIDPELGLLARFKDEFEEENIKVIVSTLDSINICFDKFLTFNFLQKHNIPVIPTYINVEEVLNEIHHERLSFPLIVKPRTGSASIGISKVNNVVDLENILRSSKDLIIQPFIEGLEYGVDCYVDLLTRNVTHIFSKKKLKMRAGETDKSESVNDLQLTVLIKKLLETIELLGPIDIDCFKTKSGFVISEVNPRFGGGYPHAHESGQNFVKNIIKNMNGLINETQIGNFQEGTIMIKFDEVMLLNKIDL